jgi:maltose O-acetyltransferase
MQPPVPAQRALHLRLSLAELAFAPVPPFVLNHLRAWALRACGVKIGFASRFWGHPSLIGTGPVASRLRVGSHCGFNHGCIFHLAAPITFGDHVSVGHQVRFLTAPRGDGKEGPAPISVGDGTWLGARCTVLGGVSIGAGAVIGAGVTVAKDVAPNMLLTGSQAISLARWR